MIKEKLKSAWNWTKRQVKNILLTLGIVGVASAATMALINQPTDTSRELISKRTATAKVYVLEDNTFETVVGTGAVHYKEDYDNDNAPWLDIDLTHRTDMGTYYLYDKMPVIVKVYKNRVGYEVISRRSTHSIKVELDSPEPDKSDVEFVVDVNKTGARILKTIKHDTAVRSFRWKITETNKQEGDYSLRVKKEKNATDAEGSIASITVSTTTPANGVYYSTETFNGKVMLLLHAPNIEIRKKIKQFKTGNFKNLPMKKKKDIKYPIVFNTDISEGVTDTTDDAGYGCSGAFEHDRNDLYWGKCCSSYAFTSGIRFQTVAIDNGGTISSAKLYIYNCDPLGCGRAVKTKLRMEDTDDAATFSTEANFATRLSSLTSAGTDWDYTGSEDCGWIYSGDFTAAAQEVVDRGGWATGQDMAVFIVDDGTSAGNFDGCRTSDFLGGAYEPALKISWEAAAAEGRRMFLVE